MTEDEVTRLRALCNAATPEPWLFSGFDARDREGKVVDVEGNTVLSLPPGVRSPGDDIVFDGNVDDLHFAAAARTALPAALDEITRLRALVEAAFREGARKADPHGQDDAVWETSDACKALGA